MERQQNRTEKQSTAATIRRRIEQRGERVWRYAHFEGHSFTAIAQALSRLARGGIIQRLGKGTYDRSRPTTFGQALRNNYSTFGKRDVSRDFLRLRRPNRHAFEQF